MTTKRKNIYTTALAILVVLIIATLSRAQVKQTMINSPGGVQSAADVDSDFRCVPSTPVVNFNRRFDLALKAFNAHNRIRDDRECLLAQWFFGEGMKRGAAVVTGSRYAHAQQPKPEVKTYTLNAEASKVWSNIDQAETELRRQFDQLEGQRATLLIGAGVPADSRQCKADEKGIIVCMKPEVAKVPEKN